MSSRRSPWKWFERALLGAVMSGIAFVIERRVLKAIRAKGENPEQAESLGTGELAQER